MSEIAALGYIGLEVSDLARWAAFAGDMLGLEVHARRHQTTSAWSHTFQRPPKPTPVP